jgi:hypothetical protein
LSIIAWSVEQMRSSDIDSSLPDYEVHVSSMESTESREGYLRISTHVYYHRQWTNNDAIGCSAIAAVAEPPI